MSTDGFNHMVSYNHNYKGFHRESYPDFRATVEGDMSLSITRLNELVFLIGSELYQGFLRYYEMVWMPYLIIIPLVDFALMNQVRGLLWFAFPEEMADGEWCD